MGLGQEMRDGLDTIAFLQKVCDSLDARQPPVPLGPQHSSVQCRFCLRWSVVFPRFWETQLASAEAAKRIKKSATPRGRQLSTACHVSLKPGSGWIGIGTQ